MAVWTHTETRTVGGRYSIVATKHGPLGTWLNINLVRGAPTLINNFSDADPFGDSTAQLTFPGITPFEDFTAPDLVGWLGLYAEVDIYWIPCLPWTTNYTGQTKVLNPLTGEADLVAPGSILNGSGVAIGWNRVKIWEGYMAAMDFTGDGSSASLQVSCQGALFQLDRYLQKPFYPAQPWPLEKLIADVFDHKKKPNLRTRPLKTIFPAGWKLKIPKVPKGTNTIYTPFGTPGELWSGYTSRQTGSWDHSLTGFVQDQLTVMITDSRSGVHTGNQWTITHQHQTETLPGRQPILQVRDRNAAADFSMWYGIPGVDIQLSRDSTQSENIIYGDGTAVDGTTWRNAVISSDGTRTDYTPLAADINVYPPNKSEQISFQGQSFDYPFVSEAYTKFGTGFDQPTAVLSAKEQLARDKDPGWTGTITLGVDPSVALPRALIRSGMVINLKGFAGTGEKGLDFHISATQHTPLDGRVELTVDTRFRDLLTVEEAQARTRDPLTPVKMLQVNRTSVMIEDIQAPWDYSAGSGFIPLASTKFFAGKPTTTPFPYTSWLTKRPPHLYPSSYVKVNANAGTTRGRWTAKAIPILTAEKGTIIRSEFICCDIKGNILKIPFHVGIYGTTVTVDAMPHKGTNYQAWRNNAFTTINPSTGNPNPVGSTDAPDASVLIVWGGRINGTYNRAGFSPGRESAGNKATGLLVDEFNWTFDNTSQKPYEPTLRSGTKEPNSAIRLYAMFYAEYKTPVYFIGRLYRQNPGVN